MVTGGLFLIFLYRARPWRPMDQDMRTALLAAACACWCQAQTTPVRVIATQPKTRSISILSVHFQELKFGHEGPSYFWVDHAPYRGKREVVEVSLYGQDAIRTVQFMLVDQFGFPLETPVVFRLGSGADADQYELLVEVPSQPFRFGIKGEDFQGRAYEKIDKQLYSPVAGNPPPLQLPPGLPQAESVTYQRMLDAYAAEVQQQFLEAKRVNPDGIIRLPRSEVLEAVYDPLLSSGGHEIGLRLRLAVRFSADGAYSVSPHFFPEYRNPDWREISLKTSDGRVSPPPVNVAADSLDDVLRYGGAANYRANQVYHFEFDLMPSYVIRNVERTRYCIYTEGFRASSRLGVFEAVQDSAAPVKYRIDIPSLDFHGETGELPPQRSYLESFQRDGAGNCGMSPSNRF